MSVWTLNAKSSAVVFCGTKKQSGRTLLSLSVNLLVYCPISIVSLWAAREELHGNILLMDGDVFFEKEVLKRVLERYQRYKPDGKIVVQHTVDAKCSGTVLKEHGDIILEAIFGDAPPLLEGKLTNYETWIFFLMHRRWKKEKAYTCGDREVTVLTTSDIQTLEGYAKFLVSNTYLEWSISKSGKFYFYEYLKLKNGTYLLNLG